MTRQMVMAVPVWFCAIAHFVTAYVLWWNGFAGVWCQPTVSWCALCSRKSEDVESMMFNDVRVSVIVCDI